MRRDEARRDETKSLDFENVSSRLGHTQNPWDFDGCAVRKGEQQEIEERRSSQHRTGTRLVSSRCSTLGEADLRVSETLQDWNGVVTWSLKRGLKTC